MAYYNGSRGKVKEGSSPVEELLLESWSLDIDQLQAMIKDDPLPRQVILVIGEPTTEDLKPLIRSPLLSTSLILLATHNTPKITLPVENSPAVRVLPLPAPLAIHDAGAVRFVSLLAAAERTARFWRADPTPGFIILPASEDQSATASTTSLHKIAPEPYFRFRRPSTANGASDAVTPSSLPPSDPHQRPFDALISFLPADLPDKALLKHTILVTTLAQPYVCSAACADDTLPINRHSASITQQQQSQQGVKRLFAAIRRRSSSRAENLVANPPPKRTKPHLVHVLPPSSTFYYSQKLTVSLTSFLTAFSNPPAGTTTARAPSYLIPYAAARSLIAYAPAPHSLFTALLAGSLDAPPPSAISGLSPGASQAIRASRAYVAGSSAVRVRRGTVLNASVNARSNSVSGSASSAGPATLARPPSAAFAGMGFEGGGKVKGVGGLTRRISKTNSEGGPPPVMRGRLGIEGRREIVSWMEVDETGSPMVSEDATPRVGSYSKVGSRSRRQRALSETRADVRFLGTDMNDDGEYAEGKRTRRGSSSGTSMPVTAQNSRTAELPSSILASPSSYRNGVDPVTSTPKPQSRGRSTGVRRAPQEVPLPAVPAAIPQPFSTPTLTPLPPSTARLPPSAKPLEDGCLPSAPPTAGSRQRERKPQRQLRTQTPDSPQILAHAPKFSSKGVLPSSGKEGSESSLALLDSGSRSSPSPPNSKRPGNGMGAGDEDEDSQALSTPPRLVSRSPTLRRTPRMSAQEYKKEQNELDGWHSAESLTPGGGRLARVGTQTKVVVHERKREFPSSHSAEETGTSPGAVIPPGEKTEIDEEALRDWVKVVRAKDTAEKRKEYEEPKSLPQLPTPPSSSTESLRILAPAPAVAHLSHHNRAKSPTFHDRPHSPHPLQNSSGFEDWVQNMYAHSRSASWTSEKFRRPKSERVESGYGSGQSSGYDTYLSSNAISIHGGSTATRQEVEKEREREKREREKLRGSAVVARRLMFWKGK